VLFFLSWTKGGLGRRGMSGMDEICPGAELRADLGLDGTGRGVVVLSIVAN
jgi:hypothetical protein